MRRLWSALCRLIACRRGCHWAPEWTGGVCLDCEATDYSAEDLD